MAIGTITLPAFPGKSIDFVAGNKKVRVRDVQLTSGANYTTGGEVITPALVGLRRIDQALSTGQARTTAGGAATIPVAMDLASTPGSVKLQQYVAATGAEQAASANQSTFSIRVTFVGI